MLYPDTTCPLDEPTGWDKQLKRIFPSCMKSYNTEIKNYQFSYKPRKFKWTNGLIVYIVCGCMGSVYYIIAKDKEIISMFEDKRGTYQIGDCYTHCYLYNNDDLIIINYGDISSIVVIKYESDEEDEEETEDPLNNKYR